MGYFSIDTNPLLVYGLIFLATFEFLVLYYAGKNQRKKIIEPSENQGQSEKYHNDFSKVGSGDQKVDVKPIDMTGNVFQHNFESIEEDFSNMKKSEEKSDE